MKIVTCDELINACTYHNGQVTVTVGDDSRLALTMVSTGGRLAFSMSMAPI